MSNSFPELSFPCHRDHFGFENAGQTKCLYVLIANRKGGQFDLNRRIRS